MWTSVPQIVVSVTLMSASPTPGSGRGTSRRPMSPFFWNTAARIVFDMAHLFKANWLRA
jgi:hypothetical protein